MEKKVENEMGTRGYRSPEVDRIWLWVCHNKIPIYPIFYLLKGDDKPVRECLSRGEKGTNILCNQLLRAAKQHRTKTAKKSPVRKILTMDLQV